MRVWTAALERTRPLNVHMDSPADSSSGVNLRLLHMKTSHGAHQEHPDALAVEGQAFGRSGRRGAEPGGTSAGEPHG